MLYYKQSISTLSSQWKFILYNNWGPLLQTENSSYQSTLLFFIHLNSNTMNNVIMQVYSLFIFIKLE